MMRPNACSTTSSAASEEDFPQDEEEDLQAYVSMARQTCSITIKLFILIFVKN